MNYIINKQSCLEEFLEGKKILYIPIYSMREYDTGLYNLACDGNVNRFLSKFSQLKSAHIDITIPMNITKNRKWLEEKLNNLSIEYQLYETVYYGENAGATRRNKNWIGYVESMSHLYDVVLFEPNVIGLANLHCEGLYWMPVSDTITGPVPFVTEFRELDIENSEKYKTFVASTNQQKLFERSYLDNNIFNPELFIDIVEPVPLPRSTLFIFNPFRQSDKGYKIKEIYEHLVDLKRKYIVFYTAPNNFEIDLPINKIRVTSDRQNYYNILASKPVVIYLEDPDEILHASIFEFLYFNCRLIYTKNTLFQHKENIGETSLNTLTDVLMTI